MKSIKPVFLKGIIATAALTLTNGCFDDKIEQITPDLSLQYIDKNGQFKTVDLLIVDPAEVRAQIRERYNLDPGAVIDFKRYPEIVSPYVTDRVKRARGSQLALRDIYERLVNPEPIYQPAKLNAIRAIPEDDEHRDMNGRALVFYPDRDKTAREWASSFSGIPAEDIKPDTGLDDLTIETFIRHHENAHAMGAGEGRADRYATLATMRERGITDRSMASLQFLADIRLLRPQTHKYALCNYEMQRLLDMVSGIYSYKAFHQDNYYDPLRSLYWEKHYIAVDEILEVRDALSGSFEDGKFSLRKCRQNAVEGRRNSKKPYIYDKVFAALERLESIQISAPQANWYASDNLLSHFHASEHPGPLNELF